MQRITQLDILHLGLILACKGIPTSPKENPSTMPPDLGLTMFGRMTMLMNQARIATDDGHTCYRAGKGHRGVVVSRRHWGMRLMMSVIDSDV